MLHLYFLSVGPVLDPVVTGCCSSPPSWLLWLSFDRLRWMAFQWLGGCWSSGSRSCGRSWLLWLSFDRLKGCRSRGSVAVVQTTPVAVVPVAPVAVVRSTPVCRSITPVAVVQLTLVAVVPVRAPVAVVRSTPVAVVPVVATVAVVQSTPVAVFPVAPVVSIDSSGWRLITRWLSFDHSSGCCLIESGGCRSSSSNAVDRSGGGCRSIAPVVAVVRSLRWWLSFDRSGGGCRLMDYGGCGSITPVAVKLLSQWLRGLSIRWLQ